VIEASLFNAGPLQDKEIGGFFEHPVAKGDRIPAIPPMRKVAVKSAVSLTRDQMRQFEVAGRRLFVPLIGARIAFDEIILPTTPEEEFQRMLGPFAPSLMCGGHTHLQQIRRMGNTLFFNPGSVGFAFSHQQPEDHFKADPWAEYAMLTYEDGRVGLEFRRVPYSAEEIRQVYLASQRPYADEAAEQYRLD
jgi:hypothetical protein